MKKMNDELMHFGILGMKWGVRRYQKEDGTRTKLGKEHRAELEENNNKKEEKKHRADSNDASFSENEQKQNMKEYADTIAEYWKGVREHKSDLDLLDQVTESSPIIKAVRQTEEYGEYADSIKAYQDYMKDNFTNNPENQQKAREFVAQKYIDDPVYDEINNYQDAVNYLGESYLNDDLYAVYQHNIDPKAEALYDGMWAKYDKAKAAADKVEEQYIGEMDYDNYKGKIRSGLDRPAGLALLGLPVRRLDESDETHHSDASSDELMHYGILGMKWGIRRFQKENGSLTKAGRERYGVGDGDGNNEKSGPKNNPNAGTSSEAESKPKARPASEMSDEELRSALNRLDMERRYNELTNPIRNDQRNNVDDRDYTMLPRSVTNVSNADLDAYIKRIRLEQEYSKLTAPPPKELTAGQKFMKEFAGPILATVAKEYVTKALKRAVGLEGDNSNKNNNNNGDNDKLNKRLNNIENSINSLRNNNNGGGKESKRQSKEEKRQGKDMDKRFDELKAMISDGIKSNLPVPADNSGSPSTVKSPTPVRPTYTERRNSLLSATSKAVQTSRQNQRYREQLISDLAKRREQRAERERREQRSEYNRAVRQDRIDSFINGFRSAPSSFVNNLRNSSPSYDLDTYPRMWRQ